MSLLEVILLALALAADAFSVGAACGLNSCSPRQVFRLSFSFGFFQAFMPVLGALAGMGLAGVIGAYDHWVAFGLLQAIGLKMIIGAFRHKERTEVCEEASDPTLGWSLLGLSVAVSIDALGAGVGMALVMDWWQLSWAVAIIGLVAAAGTWLGMRLGHALSGRLDKRIEAVAGLVLMILGLRMLLW